MVKKLIKHEISSTFKFFVPVFVMGVVGSLVFTFLTNVSLRQETVSDGFAIIIGIVVLILTGLVVASIVLMIMGLLQVSYKTLYSLTGYRQFTYPITSLQRLIVKVVTSLFWVFVTGIFVTLMIALSALITYLINEPLANFFDYAYQLLKGLLADVDILRFVVKGFDSLADLTLQIVTILFAGALANSSRFRKNRALIAFVTYFVSMIVISNVNSLMSFALFGFADTGVMSLVTIGDTLLNYQTMTLSIVINLIFIGLTAFGTMWLWDNKLEILN